MIILVSGLPGAGKTLSAVKRFILPKLAEGRKVYSNIDGLDLLKIALYLNQKPEDIEKRFFFTEKFSTQLLTQTESINDGRDTRLVVAGSFIVIDEAQVYWNNRDYASEENKSLLPFLQKHRHYGIDIVFLTQNIDQLDIGIRRLCQVHYRLVKMTNFGLDKTVKVKVFPDAMGSDQFKPLANHAWRIDKAIFPLYSSYNANSKELKIKTPNIFLHSPMFIIVMVIFTLSSFFAFRGVKSFLEKKENKNNSKQVIKQVKIGSFNDFYCDDLFLYVLRKNGKIDTLKPQTKEYSEICQD